MTGRNHGLQALAPHIHLHKLVFQHLRIDIAKADGPLGGFVGDNGLEPFAFGNVIGHHGAAGDPADVPAAFINLHTCPHDAPVNQGDGLNAPGQDAVAAEVPVHNALVGFILLAQRPAPNKFSLLRGKAHRKSGQRNRKNGHGLAAGIQPHFVPIKRQGGFQPECIPRPQPGGLCAQLYEPVPQPLRLPASDIYLIAQRLSGVSGLCNFDLVPLQLQRIQGVLHGLCDGFPSGKLHQQLLASGALCGNGRPVSGNIGYGAVEILYRLTQMRLVLVGIGGVYHQQEAVLLKAVKIRIVNGAAVRCRKDAVLSSVHIQPRNIAGEYMLQEFQPFRALDEEPPHMGYVEKTACMARIQMLRHDAGGILDRHFPPAEIHHACARCNVRIVKLCPFSFTHDLPPEAYFFHGWMLRQTKKAQISLLLRFVPPFRLRDSPFAFRHEGLHLRCEANFTSSEYRPAPVLCT